MFFFSIIVLKSLFHISSLQFIPIFLLKIKYSLRQFTISDVVFESRWPTSCLRYPEFASCVQRWCLIFQTNSSFFWLVKAFIFIDKHRTKIEWWLCLSNDWDIIQRLYYRTSMISLRSRLHKEFHPILCL